MKVDINDTLGTIIVTVTDLEIERLKAGKTVTIEKPREWYQEPWLIGVRRKEDK